MLFTELETQVQRRFGDAGMFLQTADIISWVNEGQLMLARENDYFSMTTAPITVATYLAAGGLEVPDSVLIKTVLCGDILLQERDKNLLFNMYGVTTTGQPLFWYSETHGQDSSDPEQTRSQKIKVFPAPENTSDTFTVTYGSVPTPLTANDDPIDAPEIFHPALMNFCLMRAHERNRDWQAMKMAQEAFEQDMSQRRYEGQQVSEEWPRITDVMEW